MKILEQLKETGFFDMRNLIQKNTFKKMMSKKESLAIEMLLDSGAYEMDGLVIKKSGLVLTDREINNEVYSQNIPLSTTKRIKGHPETPTPPQSTDDTIPTGIRLQTRPSDTPVDTMLLCHNTTSPTIPIQLINDMADVTRFLFTCMDKIREEGQVTLTNDDFEHVNPIVFNEQVDIPSRYSIDVENIVTEEHVNKLTPLGQIVKVTTLTVTLKNEGPGNTVSMIHLINCGEMKRLLGF